MRRLGAQTVSLDHPSPEHGGETQPSRTKMSTLRERIRRGEQVLKLYRGRNGNDRYAMAADAIADILLQVAQSHEEAVQLLQSAEIDFRNTAEGESFLTEG